MIGRNYVTVTLCIYLNAVRCPYVTLGVTSAHSPASVMNGVIMRIAGLFAAGTGRRYGDWQQARVARAARARATL